SVAWYRRLPAAPGIAHVTVLLPEGQVLSLATGRRAIAVSPDGSEIVYAGVPAGLYRRPLAHAEPVLIKGTEGLGRASEPTFSPDGRSLAFHADGAIRTIASGGGAPTRIAASDAPYGMNWGPDGIVLGQGAKGIMRVSPIGGKPE